MIHIQWYKTTAEYNEVKDNLILPNISVCNDSTSNIYYNRYVPRDNNEQGSGSSEPALEGNKVLCKYNVNDTSNQVTLYHQDSSSGSGSGSGSENTPIFSSMIVDGVEQEVANEYTFDTTGEHTVLFTLAEGVTSISESAFNGCSSLTSITIPNSVTSIGQYAFYNCSGLTNVIIGNSVTSIGEYAFNSCFELTSITIPDSVTSIGDSAFASCYELTFITIGSGVTSISDYTFSSCSKLTSIIINSNSIVSKTYTTSSNIQNIFGDQVTEYIIGGNVTSIGEYAFNQCTQHRSRSA